jgi:transposase-like protein
MARRYSAKPKFQVVTEILSGDRSAAQLAKAYVIHPNAVRPWAKVFLKKGPDIFAEDSVVARYEPRIAELEQLVGKKEDEIAVLEGFLGSGG